jgi:hypothetical protein
MQKNSINAETCKNAHLIQKMQKNAKKFYKCRKMQKNSINAEKCRKIQLIQKNSIIQPLAQIPISKKPNIQISHRQHKNSESIAAVFVASACYEKTQ